jgi:3-isopropylmalate/(R)-2-methylmalate dehydratase small subunit
MEPVKQVVGRAVPLDRENVDTDQIIPAIWMKRIQHDGFESALFEKWRRDPGFVLNQPARQGAKVLVGGSNFGCGSSREHAPWALRDWGFQAVATPGFADIFRNNLPNAGLVPVQVSQEVVDALLAATEADPSVEITVDVVNRLVQCPAAGVRDAPFALNDDAQARLVSGSDHIDLTLALEEKISAYELARQG